MVFFLDKTWVMRANALYTIDSIKFKFKLSELSFVYHYVLC